MNPHVNSYYEATLSGGKQRAALSGPCVADVCVVGGGLAGLTTALELVRYGKSVAVLEANRVGWGASGRNGGFVAAGYAEGLETLAGKLGADDARALFDLSREGVRMVQENIETFNLSAAQSRPGALSVVRYDNEAELASAPERLAGMFDYEVDYWPTDRVRSQLRTSTYFQGLYDASAIHIHPLNYITGLSAACEEAGVRIFEGSAGLRMRAGSTGWVVTTQGGEVGAEHVVLCHSTYGKGLHAGLDRAVLPVATYVVTTNSVPELLSEAIVSEAAIADTRRAGDYYRRLPDGRLLWGGRISTQRSEPARLAQMLKQDIVGIYPQLADIEIEYAWSGLMAYAVHKMPIIGSIGEGLWAATAFGGHGLNTTAIAGRLIAQAIAGGDDRYRLFEPFGTSWAGGSVGRAATQMVYWYYQLRDRIEETRAQRKTRNATGA